MPIEKFPNAEKVNSPTNRETQSKVKLFQVYKTSQYCRGFVIEKRRGV